MEYKNWTIKFEKDSDYQYAHVVAKTITAALNYAMQKFGYEIDNVTYVTSEAVDIVVE